MRLCLERKSVRHYQDKEVSDELIEKLLESAMQAPSARNQQPWEFAVVRNRELLDKLSTISTGASPLKRSPIGILTFMRKEIGAPQMAPQDMAAATQNILLEATLQGLGAVWIGVYPLEERIEKVYEIIKYKDHLTPFSLIAIGYPLEESHVTQLRYDPSRITVYK